MNNDKLRNSLKLVPKKPGCYLWKNKKNEIIYIGKAKNLFNRMHSYFSRSHNLRTQKMVSEIVDFDFIIVANENEALILESTLIKKNQPKYNVLLRENNGYPYLFLSNEIKPRLFYTKNKITELTGTYFGPFATFSSRPYELYVLLKKILPIQDCKHKWNNECFKCEILKRTHISILKENQQNFKSINKLITQILHGNAQDLMNFLKVNELKSRENWEFEEAERYFILQKTLNEIATNSYVQVNKGTIDLIAFKTTENEIAIVIFTWIDNKLITKTEKIFEYVNNWKDVFISFLYQFYQNKKNLSTVYISFIDEELNNLIKATNINFVVPKKGAIFELMKTAMNNADEKLKKYLLKTYSKKERTLHANEKLAILLNIKKIDKIEIFDISQFFGENKVGAMVVFENGEPNKNKYRKFLIKNPNIKSDLDCMKEIIIRRYTNLLDPNMKLPDLIIVDGGKAHFNLITKCLMELNLKIHVMSLVKNKKHKTRALIFQNQEIYIEDNNLMYFLTNIQDEVHRFAITFFKKKNLSSQFKNVLKEVPGMGSKRIKLIMEKYDNIKELQKKSIEELGQLIPKNIATNLLKKLNDVNQKNTALNQQIKNLKNNKK